MINQFKIPGLRVRLLMGVSLAAVSALSLTSNSARAVSECSTVSSDTTISGSTSLSVSCVDWSGGNLEIASNRMLGGDTAVLIGDSTINVGTLTNYGHLNADRGVINYGKVATILNVGTMGANGYEVISNGIHGSISLISNSGEIIGDRSTAAIVNQGTIGILSNSGTISATDSTSIDNKGSIGTITNSNKISDGIRNNFDKNINVIENSGFISSILNQGTLGSLSNSGTIAGSVGPYGAITNASADAMIIANTGTIGGTIGYDAYTSGSITPGGFSISGGDSDTKYGVLTGVGATTASSDIGKIESPFADLHFTSGYLLLNDHIDVTGHTVVNSGATLKLVNGLSITGNYTQTGGGLVVKAASSSNFGSLTVSGNAAISNTTLVMSGNNLVAGDTYTIVGAGGTGSYAITNASVVGTSGRGATTATVGKDLVVTITQTSAGYQSTGAPSGSVGASFGATLDQINNSSSPQAIAFQNNVLAAINSLPSNQQG
ncbi:hypothetical protein, partial [Thalassospira sp. MCCC 1A01428]|uniref:hypothetical protein n=1 Tax=Thalassospira sp. MCCC 1A01428 TaxID=1470575 RepID=UPI001AEFB592